MRKLIFNAALKQSEGWIQPAAVLIEEGRIQTISSGPPDKYQMEQVDEVLDANGMAMMPGIVNGHTHFSQTFMRGLASGRPLLQWLKEVIWPLQSEISVEEMQLAAMLGLVENIRGGVTEVVDHHKITRTREHTRVVHQAAEKSGMRCTIARSWANFGKSSEDDQQILDELVGWYETISPAAKTKFASGPLTPWRCSAALLQKTHELSLQYGAFTHIHVSETKEEVQMTVEKTGLRPMQWLDSIGVLDENTQIVHAVWVDRDEIDLLARRRATVIHCPVSNAVLGSGIAPVRKMLDQGIAVRLGTDGPASNDTQDCFENMKMALCLARAANTDATHLEPQDVLGMLTAGKEILEGNEADLILVNLNNLHTAPVHDFNSALTLCTHGDDVDTVIVAGKTVMRGKKMCEVDEEVLLKECNKAIKSLQKRIGLDK